MIEKPKKTRQRLTTTMMICAINDMFLASYTERQREELVNCSVVMQQKAENYRVLLFKNYGDAISEPECVYDVSSLTDFEEALGILLNEVEQALDRHKKHLLSDVNTVMDRHRGALKGARSKLKRS